MMMYQVAYQYRTTSGDVRYNVTGKLPASNYDEVIARWKRGIAPPFVLQNLVSVEVYELGNGDIGTDGTFPKPTGTKPYTPEEVSRL